MVEEHVDGEHTKPDYGTMEVFHAHLGGAVHQPGLYEGYHSQAKPQQQGEEDYSQRHIIAPSVAPKLALLHQPSHCLLELILRDLESAVDIVQNQART